MLSKYQLLLYLLRFVMKRKKMLFFSQKISIISVLYSILPFQHFAHFIYDIVIYTKNRADMWCLVVDTYKTLEHIGYLLLIFDFDLNCFPYLTNWFLHESIILRGKYSNKHANFLLVVFFSQIAKNSFSFLTHSI